MEDAPIMATNDDASDCKRAAVQLGYWDDKYITMFAKKSHRRAPEINRGYFARVKGVELFIRQFLEKTGDEAQIVNLGAGFDTLYWRLMDQGVKIACYVEVDFPTVTARKCYLIKQHEALLQKLSSDDDEIRLSETDIHAGAYHCMGVDLRNVGQLSGKLQEAGLDFQLPTLFLAECVLVYIENDYVNKILSWLATKFRSALFVNYEMCNINDNFGGIMLDNLRARGCALAGMSSCKSLETQKNRFLGNRWDGADAWDMVKIYYALPAVERQRIERLELLDEQELLMQLLQHYCICVGWIGSKFANVTLSS